MPGFWIRSFVFRLAATAATFQAVFPDSVLWVDPVGATGILLGRQAGADAPLGADWPGLERRVMKGGIDYMLSLAEWYPEAAGEDGIGFFQIGGGIAGDFPICVVPMLEQDLERPVPKWSYFCQISDSTTSYGSYSGAVPNEKITWGKLSVDTPRFIVESDATIVAPLIFSYVLGD